MKRYRALALALTLFAPAAFVGCAEEAKTETKTTTPEGSVKTTEKVEKTGDLKDAK